MKIENQVCTLEQAKKLKELGVCQESYLYHVKDITTPGTLSGKEKIIFNQHWSAFSVAELGVMLGNMAHYPHRSDRNEYWYVYLDKYEQYKTEAEVRAAVLIFRLERGAITIAEVNHLLQSA
jgi:hypothetical protein